jgi:hypothetical protein
MSKQDVVHYNTGNIFSAETDPHLSAESEQLLTMIGMEDVVVDGLYLINSTDSKNIFAKKITRKNGTTKFTIRTSQDGKLYNPISIYGKEEQKTFLDRVCRSNNKFVEVNLKTFNLYTQFLKTKNLAYLNNAERERE